MSNLRSVRRDRKRPFAHQVNKFIEEFPELKYDGAKIICVVCDKPLLCRDRSDCMNHINTGHHKYKKTGVNQRTEFMFDLNFMFMSCSLPFTLLNQPSFREFWDKYSPSNKLPCRKSLQNYIPSVREKIEQSMKSELHDKKLWLCLDKMTDCKKNTVVNVIVRTLEPQKLSSSLLLASKRLETCTGEAITDVVMHALEQFHLSNDQVLMLVTDNTATMNLVGCSLKEECGNLLHIRCKLHALHLVAEEIRALYPSVTELMSSTKEVFLKSPKRIQQFRKQCGDIPEPPALIPTHWGTWLKAAFYYFDNFHEIKPVVLQFDPKEAAVIEESQAKFQDPQIEVALKSINRNYRALVEAIEKLQNPSLPLGESMQIVDDVHSMLLAVSDAENNSVVAEFDSVLKKDLDFTKLKQMCNASASADSSDNCGDYFNYANITSLDAERSFSSYKDLFSPQRTSFAETTIETYLMLQMFNQAKPDVDLVGV